MHVHLTNQEGKDMVIILNNKEDFNKFKVGDEINMTFGPDTIHVFNKEDEKNLEW